MRVNELTAAAEVKEIENSLHFKQEIGIANGASATIGKIKRKIGMKQKTRVVRNKSWGTWSL